MLAQHGLTKSTIYNNEEKYFQYIFVRFRIKAIKLITKWVDDKHITHIN